MNRRKAADWPVVILLAIIWGIAMGICLSL